MTGSLICSETKSLKFVKLDISRTLSDSRSFEKETVGGPSSSMAASA
jgi:hypothetical protein